jgi:hypothetical protein
MEKAEKGREIRAASRRYAGKQEAGAEEPLPVVRGTGAASPGRRIPGTFPREFFQKTSEITSFLWTISSGYVIV